MTWSRRGKTAHRQRLSGAQDLALGIVRLVRLARQHVEPRPHPRSRRASQCQRPLTLAPAQRAVDEAPSRATVHRVMVRHGVVAPQGQQHKHTYKWWQPATHVGGNLSGPITWFQMVDAVLASVMGNGA